MIGRILIRRLIKNQLVASRLFAWLLNKIKRIEIKKILWLDQIEVAKTLVIRSSHHSISYAPHLLEQQQRESLVNVPKLALYQFQSVVINTRSSHIILRDSNAIVLERVPDAPIAHCDYSTGTVRHHHATYALIRRKKKKLMIPTALFIGGNGVFNFYHWLIEISPKLLYLDNLQLQKLNIQHLILDASVRDIPSFQDILKLYISDRGLQFDIIYFDTNIDLYVDQLYYFSTPNNIVFNSKHILSSPQYSFITPDSLQKIREVILAKALLEVKECKFPKKIFLARQQNAARSYNQDEILKYCKSLGFTALYMEDYSFYEQVVIFHHAEFIIGPSGAAWSNLVFCHEGCKGLSWLPQPLKEFSVFSTLAKLNQVDLKFIITQTDNDQDIHSSYSVNLEDIKSALPPKVVINF